MVPGVWYQAMFMGKILFMNFSPNKEGNTFRIGEKLLEVKDYDAVQMSDYKI